MLLALAIAPPAIADAAPSALGRWLTADRDSVIEIYDCGAALCGRIVWLRDPLDESGKPATDDENPNPALRNRPICGLDIMHGFKPDGAGAWDDGAIYDPNDGKTYHASMTLESAMQLRVRGYIGIPLLGASQTWMRADRSAGTCGTG